MKRNQSEERLPSWGHDPHVSYSVLRDAIDSSDVTGLGMGLKVGVSGNGTYHFHRFDSGGREGHQQAWRSDRENGHEVARGRGRHRQVNRIHSDLLGLDDSSTPKGSIIQSFEASRDLRSMATNRRVPFGRGWAG